MAVCGRCDCKNVLYMRKIDDIIIHCTATAEGRDVSVADIRRWHKARGFVDVGYHYVVYLDGSVHEGRPLAWVLTAVGIMRTVWGCVMWGDWLLTGVRPRIRGLRGNVWRWRRWCSC